ncbi:MAG: DNA-directed RNA polymerase subunit H [Candidatus Thermoplasmatota archaeon]|jgi:DNA-directed RNA polymerase subunit H|nr:DNA-directed RNA polymerase subunit H [Candidatus Thermoplasmatota archaeon]MCL5794140.1 DNA-directed RNA polymerase subunit H [Candidatus Thermoplasmatota archaeon]
MARFNVLKHEMVPEHSLVSKKEEETLLRSLEISKELLPRINRNDPAIKALEEISGPIPDGSIIRIVRKSPTAGSSVYYRVLEEGVFK